MNDKNNKTQEIMSKLESGIKDTLNSENFKQYLKFQSKFHSYSANNALLIFFQNPNATRVAGYKTWQSLGRQVLKGEKGISILAPRPFSFQKEVKEIDPITKEPVKNVKEVKGLTFHTVSVFDVSQTDGRELPSICNELVGDNVNAKQLIDGIKKICDIPIKFIPLDDGSKGYYNRVDDFIAIKEGMSDVQTAKTLIHEYAHSQLHKVNNPLFDRATKEVQAESVAYVVSNYFGIDTSDYSFEYVANWSSTKELPELHSSLDLIQKTSNVIIDKSVKVISEQIELDVKDNILNQYSAEFPAIAYISLDTALKINELNLQNGSPLKISDIFNKHNDLGKKLEVNENDNDLKDFNNLDGLVKDINQAKMKEMQEQARNSNQNELVKVNDIEMSL